MKPVFTYNNGGSVVDTWVLTKDWEFKRYHSKDYIEGTIPGIISHFNPGNPYVVQLFSWDGKLVDGIHSTSVPEAIKILIMENPDLFGKETVLRVVEKKMQILENISNKCVVLVRHTECEGYSESNSLCLYGIDTFEGHFLKDALEDAKIPFFVIEGLYVDSRFCGTCAIRMKNFGNKESMVTVSEDKVLPTVKYLWKIRRQS